MGIIKNSLQPFYRHYWEDFHLVRRLEWDVVKKWLGAKKGEKICGVACGEGCFEFKLAKKGCKVFGFDVNPAAIRIANKYNCLPNSEFKVGNAEKIPYPPNFFDKVFSICSIEHFKDDMKSLREMNRILKPGGLLVMTADSMSYGVDEDIRKMDQERYDVVRYYKIGDLEKKLQKAGFKLDKSKYIFNSPISTWFFRIGMRLQFIRSYLILFPFMYPLAKVSDFLFGKEDGGIILVVRAIKVK